MCVYLYIHDKYTQHTHTHTHIMQTKTFILDAINRLKALKYFQLKEITNKKICLVLKNKHKILTILNTFLIQYA